MLSLQSLLLLKYPRTPHLEGSRLQEGDDGSDQVALSALKGLYVVIEEKLDGANSAISFSEGGDLLLQSRGHYLVGGASERQFNLLKPWALAAESSLMSVLDDRYVMYGEWAYSKHSVFYDSLPHYFNEFDILDRKTGQFLSTARRHALLVGTPVLSVPVVYAGLMLTNPKLLWKLVGASLAKTSKWRKVFKRTVRREGLPLDLTWKQTDKNDRTEGLYLKVEDDEQVLARYKLVRSDFVQTILDSGSHHSRRPIVPNQLAPGVDLYAATPTVTWESLGLVTLHSAEEVHAAKAFDPRDWVDDDEEDDDEEEEGA